MMTVVLATCGKFPHVSKQDPQAPCAWLHLTLTVDLPGRCQLVRTHTAAAVVTILKSSHDSWYAASALTPSALSLTHFLGPSKEGVYLGIKGGFRNPIPTLTTSFVSYGLATVECFEYHL